jgi:ferrochelatase
MKNAVLLLNFGEPEIADKDAVIAYLKRIFAANATLERPSVPEEATARWERLARTRAPTLIDEYRLIGGSPLNRQAKDQAELLARELRNRGHDAVTFVGMQFASPSIPSAVEAARNDGAEYVVALPVYPLAGPSTTDAALGSLRQAIREQGWSVPVHEIPVWHRCPSYVDLRADGVRSLAMRHGLDLGDPDTRLVFSAHGTPCKYLDEGSRYVEYVREFCSSLAARLGVGQYWIGYQNHGNRPDVKWIQPEVASVVRLLASEGAKKVIVDPVSFMHEQSETLGDLDHELRGVAENAGLAFYRVPIPHDSPRFIQLLADLVEGGLQESIKGVQSRSSRPPHGAARRTV